jgi:hypothetical protein
MKAIEPISMICASIPMAAMSYLLLSRWVFVKQ